MDSRGIMVLMVLAVLLGAGGIVIASRPAVITPPEVATTCSSGQVAQNETAAGAFQCWAILASANIWTAAQTIALASSPTVANLLISRADNLGTNTRLSLASNTFMIDANSYFNGTSWFLDSTSYYGLVNEFLSSTTCPSWNWYSITPGTNPRPNGVNALHTEFSIQCSGNVLLFGALQFMANQTAADVQLLRTATQTLAIRLIDGTSLFTFTPTGLTLGSGVSIPSCPSFMSNTNGGNWGLNGFEPVNGLVASQAEATQQMVMPSKCVAQNEYAKVTTAPGGTVTWTIVLRVNGADSALKCTITGAATSCTDTTHKVTLNAGDLVNWQTQVSAPPANTGQAFISADGYPSG